MFFGDLVCFGSGNVLGSRETFCESRGCFRGVGIVLGSDWRGRGRIRVSGTRTVSVTDEGTISFHFYV